MSRFDYAHLTMKLPHEIIVKNPDVLLCREHRLKERHEFLKYLGKDQYNTKKELYVSMKALALSDDLEFVTNVARSNMLVYENFLKTL